MNQSLELIFKSLDSTNKGYLKKEDFLSSSQLINLTENDLENLFPKNLKELNFKDFQFYITKIHPLNELDHLIYFKIKSFNLLRKLNSIFKTHNSNSPEIIFDQKITSGLISLIIGDELENYHSKLKFALNIKSKKIFNCLSHLESKSDVSFVIRLKLNKEKSLKSEEALKEFQKLIKMMLVVGQNLNKKFKEITKKLIFSYGVYKNYVQLIISSSDDLKFYLLELINMLNSFFPNTNEEYFLLTLQSNNSLNLLYDNLIINPEKGILEFFKNFKFEISGFIEKFENKIINLSEKNFQPLIENILSFFLLLKSLKGKIILNSFDKDDLINFGFFEFIPFELLLDLKNFNFNLPKIPILKKFYQFSVDYLQADLRVDFKIGDYCGKLNVKTVDLINLIDKIIKFSN